MWSRAVRWAGGGWWILLTSCLLSPYAEGAVRRKHDMAYVVDPVGLPLSKPSHVPTKVGSPASLVQPDRYEFYTFDESGELIKRLMTLREIQEIIATGDGDDGHVLTIAQTDLSKPPVTFNFQPPSHTKVHNIVSNVQNVLKAEMEAQKTNLPKDNMFDTPDVSSSWSMILPAIFGNTGGNIAPDSLISQHSGPETDVIINNEKYETATEIPSALDDTYDNMGKPNDPLPHETEPYTIDGNDDDPENIGTIVDSQVEDLLEDELTNLSKTTNDIIISNNVKTTNLTRDPIKPIAAIEIKHTIHHDQTTEKIIAKPVTESTQIPSTQKTTKNPQNEFKTSKKPVTQGTTEKNYAASSIKPILTMKTDQTTVKNIPAVVPLYTKVPENQTNKNKVHVTTEKLNLIINENYVEIPTEKTIQSIGSNSVTESSSTLNKNEDIDTVRINKPEEDITSETTLNPVSVESFDQTTIKSNIISTTQAEDDEITSATESEIQVSAEKNNDIKESKPNATEENKLTIINNKPTRTEIESTTEKKGETEMIKTNMTSKPIKTIIKTTVDDFTTLRSPVNAVENTNTEPESEKQELTTKATKLKQNAATTVKSNIINNDDSLTSNEKNSVDIKLSTEPSSQSNNNKEFSTTPKLGNKTTFTDESTEKPHFKENIIHTTVKSTLGNLNTNSNNEFTTTMKTEKESTTENKIATQSIKPSLTKISVSSTTETIYDDIKTESYVKNVTSNSIQSPHQSNNISTSSSNSEEKQTTPKTTHIENKKQNSTQTTESTIKLNLNDQIKIKATATDYTTDSTTVKVATNQSNNNEKIVSTEKPEINKNGENKIKQPTIGGTQVPTVLKNQLKSGQRPSSQYITVVVTTYKPPIRKPIILDQIKEQVNVSLSAKRPTLPLTSQVSEKSSNNKINITLGQTNKLTETTVSGGSLSMDVSHQITTKKPEADFTTEKYVITTITKPLSSNNFEVPAKSAISLEESLIKNQPGDKISNNQINTTNKINVEPTVEENKPVDEQNSFVKISSSNFNTLSGPITNKNITKQTNDSSTIEHSNVSATTKPITEKITQNTVQESPELDLIQLINHISMDLRDPVNSKPEIIKQNESETTILLNRDNIEPETSISKNDSIIIKEEDNLHAKIASTNKSTVNANLEQNISTTSIHDKDTLTTKISTTTLAPTKAKEDFKPTTEKNQPVTKQTTDNLSESITNVISQIFDDSRSTIMPISDSNDADDEYYDLQSNEYTTLNSNDYKDEDIITSKTDYNYLTTQTNVLTIKAESKTEATTTTLSPKHEITTKSNNKKAIPLKIISSTQQPIKFTEQKFEKEQITSVTPAEDLIIDKGDKNKTNHIYSLNKPSTYVSNIIKEKNQEVTIAEKTQQTAKISESITKYEKPVNIIVSTEKNITPVSTNVATPESEMTLGNTEASGTTQDDEMMEMLNQYSQMFKISSKNNYKKTDSDPESEILCANSTAESHKNVSDQQSNDHKVHNQTGILNDELTKNATEKYQTFTHTAKPSPIVNLTDVNEKEIDTSKNNESQPIKANIIEPIKLITNKTLNINTEYTNITDKPQVHLRIPENKTNIFNSNTKVINNKIVQVGSEALNKPDSDSNLKNLTQAKNNSTNIPYVISKQNTTSSYYSTEKSVDLSTIKSESMDKINSENIEKIENISTLKEVSTSSKLPESSTVKLNNKSTIINNIIVYKNDKSPSHKINESIPLNKLENTVAATTTETPVNNVTLKNDTTTKKPELKISTTIIDEQKISTQALESISTAKETSTVSSAPQTKAVDNVTENPHIIRDKIETQEYKIPQDKKVNSTSKPEDIKAPLVIQNENEWKLIPTVIPHSETTKPKITNRIGEHNSGQPQRPLYTHNNVNGLKNYQSQHIGQIHLPGINGGEGLEKTTTGLGEDVYQFSQLCNELAFRYWDAVSANGIDNKRSLALSPFSVTSILAMVFLGARGATSGEMNDILKLDDMVTFNPHIVFKNVTESIEVSKKSGIATSAFIRELYSDRAKGRLLSFYKDRVQQFYSGHVEEVNFKVIGDIIRRRTNLLVKRQTWGKIPEYIKSNNMILRPPLSIFSANIMQTDCSVASTDGRDGEMYFVVSPTIRQRRLIPVPAVVYKSGFLAGYVPELDATVVAADKGDQIVSTIFVMPGQQGSTAQGDDILDLEKRLINSAVKDDTWAKLLRSLIPRQGLELQIPRFSHRSVINGSAALKQMGLKDLFDAEKADLRGLNGQANDLYLADLMTVNTFSTCGEGYIADQHHVEVYPGEPNKIQRRLWRTPHRPIIQDTIHSQTISEIWDEPRDYQRAFHDPLHDTSYLLMPLHLRPRQARLPDPTPEPPRLKFDRPFMFFVRHNPTGLILHMGRYNPRLLP